MPDLTLAAPRIEAAKRAAATAADVPTPPRRAVREVTRDSILDDILLETAAQKPKVSRAALVSALATIVLADQQARFLAVAEPLLRNSVSNADRLAADAAWDRLCSGVFDLTGPVPRAVLEHFMWQVKQKLLGRTVTIHLMPIVFSPIQGGGKTTFVRRFLAPWQELAAGPVLLSDLADVRSGDIYRFPIAFVDDVKRLEVRQVPVLKSLLSARAFSGVSSIHRGPSPASRT